MTMAGELVFELPTGWLGPDGQVHRRVEMREMTGYEEDVIGDDRLPYNVRMNRVLAGCVVKLGPITDKAEIEKIMDQLTSVDRMKLLIMIRVASLPEPFEFDVTCPSCSKKGTHQLDLLTLQFEGLKDPKVREYELSLPSGRKAVCRVLTGELENRISELERADIMSGSILLRLAKLDGKADLTLEDVKKMPLKDRTALRNKFDEIEGGFERDIQVSCKNCRKEFETRLDLGVMELLYKNLKA
jgi:hypothetical protein